MTRILLIPGLVCDGHVWEATRTALNDLPVSVADVTTQPSITAMANDLLAHHDGPLVVAGHSMGGRVAMEMAHIAPERIRAMALLNTGMHPRKDGEGAKRQSMIDLAYAQGMDGLASAWLPGMMAEGLTPDPEVLDGLTRMVCRMTPEIHERQMRALLDRPDASATISAYTGPMLLIVGRQDQWSPIAQHEAIAQLCPQARLEIVENAGHFAPVEQPAAVAGLLSDWVRSLNPE
ncbi:alpha/beta fold hydrolase [Roseinatronobacter alkalisoli]|uniref:Alpha/beta hydrolase n=1 Tax=Roseinatronobacter alkalisoli TaxID=3028235 RepID=A0ABT5TAA7_9RHOB|nr:alpha/beta hydrolase [Roseinatronobacter sp. HJB301]MDD7972060.1 alpha/beta hydrolase [Roseinatronobacter sp. HJB301]